MKKYFLQKQTCILLAILFFVSAGKGQAKLVKTQGTNPYNNICCGLQDKAGNLWFGSSGEGVYRYDGKSFTQFSTKDGLNSNSVCSILEDRNGDIWFGTSDGICRYNGKEIIRMPFSGNLMSAISSNSYYNSRSTKSSVWSLLQDKSGKIWLGTGSDVYCYDGKRFSRFLDNPALINKDNLQLKMVDCIFEDKNGSIWFASGMPPGEEGICRYDGKNLVRFKPKNEGWFRKIIEDKDGNLLFATRKSGVLFCKLSADSLSIASFSKFAQPKELLNNSLTTILQDRAGNIWMASDYGNTIGDTLGGAWYYKRSPEATEKAFTKITAKDVFFMLEDRAGNIWLGTRNMGLYRYDGKTFTSFAD